MLSKPLVEIIRLEEFPAGIIGVMLFDGHVFGNTLELPWKDNRPFESCVPTGIYECHRRQANMVMNVTKGKLKETFEITNVKGNRADVFFYPATIQRHELGSIVLGRNAWALKAGARTTLNSGGTFLRFMQSLKGKDNFLLSISLYRH